MSSQCLQRGARVGCAGARSSPGAAVCAHPSWGEAEHSSKPDSSASSPPKKSGRIFLEGVFCWCLKDGRNARICMLFLVFCTAVVKDELPTAG